MRKVKIKFFPSLEESDTEDQLQDALTEERENEQKTEEELSQTLNNKQGFEASSDDSDDSVEIEVTGDQVDSTGGNVQDVIAEEVVKQSTGEGSVGMNSFLSKMKSSYAKAQSNGFAGTFDEFLGSISDSIEKKETEPVQNPLGTDSGSGEETEIESELPSDNEEVIEEIEESDQTTDDGEDKEKSVSEDSEENDTDDEEEESDDTEDTSSEDTNLNGEEIEDESDTVEEVDDPEATDDETLNEYIDEVDKDQEEIDNTDEMVEEATDSSSRLGRIAEIVQDAIQDTEVEGEDGEEVSESLAKIAEIANECYSNRFGIKQKYSLMVSNENLREALTPTQRCEIALEGIGDTAKKIFDAILKAIEASMQWLDDQYKKFLLNTGLMERRLAKIERYIKEADPKATYEKSFKSAKLFNALATDGIIKNQALEINLIFDISKTIYKEVNDWVIKTGLNIVSIFRAVEKKDTSGITNHDINKITMPTFSGLNLAPVPDPVSKGLITEKEFNESTLIFAMGRVFPGNKAITIAIPNLSVEINKSVEKNENPLHGLSRVWGDKKIGVKFSDIVVGNRDMKLDDIPTLTIEEMKSIVVSLKELLIGIKEYNKASDDIKKARKTIKRYVSQLRNANFIYKNAFKHNDPNSEKGIGKSSLNYLTNILATANRSLSEPTATFTSYCLRMAAVEMSYIYKSLELHGVKEKADKTDESKQAIADNDLEFA